MSTPFYDLASLVLVPSGYKSQKVYAQKPLTTDGQLTFSRASTATRVNSAGLIETVSSNVPRLDYTNSSCPKILLEPQRTQKLTYSNTFTNAAWNKAYQGTGLEPVITANYGTDPFGGNNASRVQLNLNGGTTSSDRSWLIQNFSPSATVTLSMYIKLNTAGTRTLIFADSGAATVTVNSTSWTRISQVQSGGSGEFRFGLVGGYSENTLDASICYAQCEEGSCPTSIIVSTTAAVTRLADACSKTGISSLIGQTEGTLFADVEINNIGQAADRGIVSVGVNGAGYTSAVYISFYGNDIYLACFVAGSPQIASVSKTITTAGRYKIAAGYKDNDFVLYVNGQLAGSDNSGSLPSSMSVFTIDGINQGFNGYHTYNESMVFASRLTNAQLAELTTL